MSESGNRFRFTNTTSFRGKTTSSVMQVTSVRPELEFEVIKLLLLRESYIKRLNKRLPKSHEVDLSITGLFEALRETSVQVVESLREWERAQVDYPLAIKPFMWNGQNYIEKMCGDLEFLESYEYITTWLRIPLKGNPFMVPIEILSDQFVMPPSSLLVFGERPQKEIVIPKKPKAVFVKSPYLTPIVNDAELIPSISALNKYKKSQKQAGASTTGNSNNEVDEYQKSIVQYSDPFQTFLSNEMIIRIQKCWKIVKKVYSVTFSIDASQSIALEGSLSNFLMRSDRDLISPEPSFAGSSLGDIATTMLQTTSPHASFFPSSSQQLDLNVTQNSKFSLIDAAVTPTEFNSSMRNTSKILSADGSTTINLSSSKIWSQHEISMQRAVHRRGGELFVITAAGSKGKMKPPLRRTRLERMYKDLERLTLQSDQLSMQIEDPTTDFSQSWLKELKEKVTLSISFLKYQYDHFQMLSEGDMLSLDKQKKAISLKSGEPMDTDEVLSMSLEDRMVIKIQKIARKKFGKTFRRIALKNMQKAALKIQCFWRRRRLQKWFRKFYYGKRLIRFLIPLFKRVYSYDNTADLTLTAIKGHAAKFIQRVWRGCMGKYKANMRKKFIDSIRIMNENVSNKNILPSHLEELTEEIEYFLRDYTKTLPVEILSIMRAVLYMTNGDEPEYIIVESGGVYEKLEIYADNLGWNGIKHLLRRKGRFLRRLKALARMVQSPNANPFEFSDECVEHLNSVCDAKISPKAFDSMLKGKHFCKQILYFLNSARDVYAIQDDYMDYFSPTNPTWFRKLITQRRDYEVAEAKVITAEKCVVDIRDERDKRKAAGLKIGEVQLALDRAIEMKLEAKKLKREVCRKLQEFIEWLDYTEKTVRESLAAMRVNRNMSKTIAERDLKYYVETALNIDEKRLRELHFNVDEKTMALVDHDVLILKTELKWVREKAIRNFDSIYDISDVRNQAEQLGAVLAELFVLENDWKEFLVSIGGLQYVSDLVGTKKDYYANSKQKAMVNMSLRRMLTLSIDKGIKDAIQLVWDKTDSITKVLRDQNWDFATEPEIAAEVEEDLMCAKRDVDVSARQRRQADWATIETAVVKPVLCLVDTRIPRNLKQSLIEKLKVVNFRLCNHDQRDPNAIVHMQHLLDEGMHILLFVDRGVNRAARSIFVGDLKTILDCLLPAPKAICVDATNAFRYENWTSLFSLDQTAMTTFNISDSCQMSLILCKLRKYGYQLRQCLFNKGTISKISEDGYDSETRRLDEEDEEEERLLKEKVEKEAADLKAKEDAEKNQSKGRFSLFGGRSSSPSGIGSSLAASFNLFGGRKTPDPEPHSAPPEGKSGDESHTEEQRQPKEQGKSFGRLSLFGTQKSETAGDKRSVTPSKSRFSLFGGGDKKTPEKDAKYKKEEDESTTLPSNIDFTENQGELFLKMKSQASIAKLNTETAKAKKKAERKAARLKREAKAKADANLMKDINALEISDPEKAAQMRAKREADDAIEQLKADKKADVDLGMTAPIDLSMKDLYAEDLNDLYNSIRVDIGEDENSLTGMISPPTPDVLLATVFCAITGKWKAPLIEWRLRDFKNGALTFLEDYATPQVIFAALVLIPLPISTVTDACRLDQIKQLIGFWDYSRKTDYYCNPVRYILLNWCIYAIELIQRLAYAGGAALDKQDEKFFSSSKILEWDHDICNKNLDAFVGILLHGCLKEAEVYECKCNVIEIVNRSGIYDFSSPMKSFRTIKVESVIVYHYNDDIYICIKVPGVVLRYYFGSISTLDFIKMLQPNSTEIFEGRVKKINTNSEESSWKHLAASWARISFTETSALVRPVRVQYLILSSFRKIDGFDCRLEVYEGTYMQAEVFVHLADQKTPLRVQVDSEMITILLKKCKNNEEKARLESFDLSVSASVFLDRIHLCPPLRWRHFIELTSSTNKKVDMNLKINYRRGPGRLVGRRTVKLLGVYVIISVFELYNESDSYSMRIVLYEPKSKVSAEYQFSSMERLSIFNNDTPVILQIEKRLRISRCCVDSSMVVIKLSKEFEHPDVGNFTNIAGSVENTLTYVPPDISVDTDDVNYSSSWMLYLFRGVVARVFGNVEVSVTLCETFNGFQFILYDTFSHIEVRRKLSYEEFVTYSNDMSIEELQHKLSVLNEDTAFTILEAVISLVDMRPCSIDDERIDRDTDGKISHQVIFGCNEDGNPFVLGDIVYSLIITSEEKVQMESLIDESSAFSSPLRGNECVLVISSIILEAEGETNEDLNEQEEKERKKEKEEKEEIEEIEGNEDTAVVKEMPTEAVFKILFRLNGSILHQSSYNPIEKSIQFNFSFDDDRNLSENVLEFEFWSNEFSKYHGSFSLKGWEVPLFFRECRMNGDVPIALGFYTMRFINADVRKYKEGRFVCRGAIGHDSDLSLKERTPVSLALNTKPVQILFEFLLSAAFFLDYQPVMGKKKKKAKKLKSKFWFNGKNFSSIDCIVEESTGNTVVRYLVDVPSSVDIFCCFLDLFVIKKGAIVSSKSISGAVISNALSGADIYEMRALPNIAGQTEITTRLSLSGFSGVPKHPTKVLESSVIFTIDLETLVPDAIERAIVAVWWNGVHVYDVDVSDKKAGFKSFGMERSESQIKNRECILVIPQNYSLSSCILEFYFEIFDSTLSSGLRRNKVMHASVSKKELETLLQPESDDFIGQKQSIEFESIVTEKFLDELDLEEMILSVCLTQPYTPPSDVVDDYANIDAVEHEGSAEADVEDATMADAGGNEKDKKETGTSPVAKRGSVIHQVRLSDLLMEASSDSLGSSVKGAEQAPTDPRQAIRISTMCDENRLLWRYEFPGIFNKSKSLLNLSTSNDFVEGGSVVYKSPTTLPSLSSETVEETSLAAHSVDGSVHTQNSPSGKYLPSHVVIEHACMRHSKQKQSESAGVDTRICWRGKFFPKEVVISDAKLRQALMIPRSSKLVIGHTLSQLTPLAEITYLEDENYLEGDRPDELPTLFKEITSTGPGFVQRVYRVEIYTNNGLLLGSADIANMDDFREVLGEKYAELLKPGSEELDMVAAFNYIVSSRLKLKLTVAVKEDKDKDDKPKRGGLWQSSSMNALSGSKVILLRDEMPSIEDDESVDSSIDSAIEEADKMRQLRDFEKAKKSHKLRVYTKNHKYSGKKFRVLIFFRSSSFDVFKSPNRFFSSTFHYDDNLGIRSKKTKALLEALDILFLFQENRVNTIRQLLLPGHIIAQTIPPNMLLDFSTKFRRESFGLWLAKNIQMTFTVLEDCHFKFFNLDVDY